MKKRAMILSGLAIFDLGVIVIPAAADAAPAAQAGGPVAQRETVDSKHGKVTGIKVNLHDMQAVRACGLKLGKIVQVAGQALCELPTDPRSNPR